MDHDTIHEKYMHRCIELAALGLGTTAPNPMVGSVIVANDRILGEGYHQVTGGPHAEVNAVHSVKDKALLKESILYVNLEPCAHTGKTPPCSDLIIQSGIPKVVIGTLDPNTLVSGRGIERMKKAGISVETGICKEACIKLNKRFFTAHLFRRPYVILKWAQSEDGYIDIMREKNEPAQPHWISGEISRKLVHKWRTEEQAIMVGTNTAMKDNPRLTSREWPGRNPVRIVLDRTLKLPVSLNLFDNATLTWIINELKDAEKGNCVYKKLPFNGDLLPEVMNLLIRQGLQSVIVEGGRKLLYSFIQSGLWDEARVFTGNKSFVNGIKAPEIGSGIKMNTTIGNDLLTIIYNETMQDKLMDTFPGSDQ
jgi:diaminohydroxyphosphoribosylaminopyrimidine deaminase/5-amino-6-(5-phosphoribosylamino)uracil reductase